MSKESQKGNSFAEQFANYAARKLGDDIERRVLHGTKDRGDIAGLYIRGKRTAVECKNCKRMDLSGWINEAEEERANDDAEFGIVVHKRRGYGEAKFGGNYVTMTVDTLLGIVAGAMELLED